ncbi:hypothetical protein HL670_03363 [Serratia plymuthica]|nr:hypothetical protein HL670_03363 [Serratia plymuthica]
MSAQSGLEDWESAVSLNLLPMQLAISGINHGEQPQLLSRFRRLATFRMAGLSVEGVTALPRTDITEGGYLKILFVTNGRSQIWREGVPVALEAGTWTLYDPRRPYRIDPIGLCDYVALAMPVDAVPGIHVRATEVAQMAFPIEGNMLLALQAITLCLDILRHLAKALLLSVQQCPKSGIFFEE